MVNFTGFSWACFFSSLGFERGLFSSRVLGLMSSFSVRPLPSSTALVLPSSLALELTGSLALGLNLLILLCALELCLHASRAFLAALRLPQRLRGLRVPRGVPLGERTPSSNLERPGFLFDFRIFQTLK